MIKNIDDRRVRRSRKLLKEGLLELMHRKKFNEISAKNITDLKDLNRSTFYLHYADTVALLHSIEDDLEQEVQELINTYLPEIRASKSVRPIFEPILDFVVENFDTCALLFDNNEASNFTERLQMLIYKNGVDLVREKYHPENEELMSYLLDFFTFGMLGLVQNWCKNKMALPKAELIEMADRLLDGAAEGVFGK